MAKAARAGHTQRYAKLAAETAKHRKLQECKVFTWLFVRRKTVQVVVGSNFEPLGSVPDQTIDFGHIGGNQMNIPW